MGDEGDSNAAFEEMEEGREFQGKRGTEVTEESGKKGKDQKKKKIREKMQSWRPESGVVRNRERKMGNRGSTRQGWHAAGYPLEKESMKEKYLGISKYR